MPKKYHPIQFVVIGLDDSPTPYLPPSIQEIIYRSKIFSGGIRHHDIVSAFLPKDAEWIDITVPLDAVFARYEAYDHIVVFASGDPLFFGFANTIRRRLPQAEIQLYPTFNSLQILAHRLVMPYDDMRTVSLTGRPWHEFDKALIERTPKIGILTDREHTPATIAQRMLEYGYTHYVMHVGEHLGNPQQERIRRLELTEAAEQTFEYPNCLIVNLHAGAHNNLPQFGIPDKEFELLDGRTKMITKAPIRLLTLSSLELNRRVSFWDVGFCTGSVSIEAKQQFPHLHITSFEIRPEGERLMEVNSRRFGTPGINIVIGDFLKADLDSISRPDAVFIGGHGGHLKEMIIRISHYLLPGGCIVFNSVSEVSKSLFVEGIKEAGLRLFSETRIAVDEYNPIEILKAEQQ